MNDLAKAIYYAHVDACSVCSDPEDDCPEGLELWARGWGMDDLTSRDAVAEMMPPHTLIIVATRCFHARIFSGYGLAGGGMGPYRYCTDCGQMMEKTQDDSE